MNPEYFYITTTLPYVNSDPHVGFAMEIIRADVIARWKRSQGAKVFFNTGTDEHGTKILEKAQEKGIDVKAYVDENAASFRKLADADALNLSVDNFIRTTDEQHIKSAQAFWNVCKEKGDIYKKIYKVKYCVGCELEKTDSELVDGRCPIHPDRDIELIEEENYFFKASKYSDQLLKHYKENPHFVLPDSRLHEITTFIEKNGLSDFSVSRLKHKMPWGIAVPGDDEHVMYVWFDALVNYVSAIGWPHNMEEFQKWGVQSGGMVQYCGKDNLRQQSAMWQSMLLSTGLPLSKCIIVGGFINSGGQKMSKSLGNVINPFDVVHIYKDLGAISGSDALRYFLISEIPTFEDGDMTLDRMRDSYETSLADGVGNLTSRILTMSDKYAAWPTKEEHASQAKSDWANALSGAVSELLQKYEVGKAAERVMHECRELDRRIQESEPFKLFKTDEVLAKNIVKELVSKLRCIAVAFENFIPQTAQEIISHIDAEKKLEKPLFPKVKP